MSEKRKKNKLMARNYPELFVNISMFLFVQYYSISTHCSGKWMSVHCSGWSDNQWFRSHQCVTFSLSAVAYYRVVFYDVWIFNDGNLLSTNSMWCVIISGTTPKVFSVLNFTLIWIGMWRWKFLFHQKIKVPRLTHDIIVVRKKSTRVFLCWV